MLSLLKHVPSSLVGVNPSSLRVLPSSIKELSMSYTNLNGTAGGSNIYDFAKVN